jgi:uncharacterized SAM-binding protein YcdF (DUF218 family)
LNTWQNAQLCAAWLQSHPQDQIVLVTSGVHVRRSLLYFGHFGVRAMGVRFGWNVEARHSGSL